MKKLLIGLLCLAVCGTVAMTSCGKKEVEEKVEEKTITLDFTDDFVEPVPVFQYRFSGGEAVLEKYNPDMAEDGLISAKGMELKDSMEVAVYGNEERILLVARYDNLGKGASGAALQCMNIVMGADETTGLDI